MLCYFELQSINQPTLSCLGIAKIQQVHNF
jgi:hypothetical protein